MKKIFRFSLVLALSATLGFSTLYSCSSDSAEIETEKTATKSLSDSDLAKAKVMYKAMTLTPEWADYAGERDAFAANMLDNAVFFTKKSDYMNWIQSNLSSTSFQSVGDFEESFDKMTSSYDTLMVQNETLFNYIADADGDQYYPIMQSGLPVYDVESNGLPCVLDCLLTFAQEFGDAVNNYNLDVQAVTSHGMPNLIGACESRFIVYATGAVKKFTGCVKAC